MPRALSLVLAMAGFYGARVAGSSGAVDRRGTLPVSPELEAELIRTCAAVLAIRAELMRALGYAPEDRT